MRVIAILSAFSAASAQTFTVDASAQTVPLNVPILDCVGSGHGSLALREDYRQHLRTVQRDIGFAHIRGHGLLDDDMSTFLDGSSNLINLFSVFDFYLSVGVKPIFELSFMPQALASDPSKTIMHYAGGTSPPKSPAAWAAFISGIFEGLVQRYGSEEVQSWRIEVWNEVRSEADVATAQYFAVDNPRELMFSVASGPPFSRSQTAAAFGALRRRTTRASTSPFTTRLRARSRASTR